MPFNKITDFTTRALPSVPAGMCIETVWKTLQGGLSKCGTEFWTEKLMGGKTRAPNYMCRSH